MLNSSFEIVSEIKTLSIIGICFLALIIVSCGKIGLEHSGNAQSSVQNSVQLNANLFANSDLGNKARSLAESSNQKSCRDFFTNFPSTFEEFNDLYGFSDETGPKVLYSQYQNHVTYFFGCTEVSDSEKLSKSINIGINGRWEADATSLLQNGIYDLVAKQPNEAKSILDDLSEETASSFWLFLLDGPHPGDSEKIKKVKLLKDFMGATSKQAELIENEFRKLVKADSH